MNEYYSDYWIVLRDITGPQLSLFLVEWNIIPRVTLKQNIIIVFLYCMR